MPHYYNDTIRDARMNAIVTEAGAGALLKAYDGTQPASGGALSSNTLIAELTGAATLGTVTGGVLTFNAVTGDTSANASGTPTFIRIFKSDGVTLVGDLATPTFPACTAGNPVDITSLTITEGNG